MERLFAVSSYKEVFIIFIIGFICSIVIRITTDEDSKVLIVPVLAHIGRILCYSFAAISLIFLMKDDFAASNRQMRAGCEKMMAMDIDAGSLTEFDGIDLMNPQKTANRMKKNVYDLSRQEIKMLEEAGKVYEK